MEPIRGFKGFRPGLICTPNGKKFQYEIGKTYEEDKAKACETGFHFCEHPLDVFSYYPPSESEYAEVEGDGKIDRHNDDSKIACTKINIVSKISLSAMIEAAIKFTFDRATWTKDKTTDKDSGAASATGYSGAASATGYSGAASATGAIGAASATGYSGAASATGARGAASATGDRGAASATGASGAASATGDSGAASATGDRGAASATGDSGAASATGDSGAASATGEHSIACGLGVECKAKGALGCWIVLAERKWNGNGYAIKTVKTVKVDGKKIKPDTWYVLTKGKFVKVD